MGVADLVHTNQMIKTDGCETEIGGHHQHC
jgi:hypothetical protein